MERSTRFIPRKWTSTLLNTAWLWGQVSVVIPKLGTTLPPAVPNWLQSPLKPRAQLCMEVVTDRGDQRPRVDYDESKIEQDPRWIVLRVWNRVLVSASKVRWPELSQLSLCSEFDKENSMEFSLISLSTYTFYYCGYALILPWSSCYSSHVTPCDCDLWRDHPWHCDKVTWYFPMLHLAILPSHDKNVPIPSLSTYIDQ